LKAIKTSQVNLQQTEIQIITWHIHWNSRKVHHITSSIVNTNSSKFLYDHENEKAGCPKVFKRILLAYIEKHSVPVCISVIPINAIEPLRELDITDTPS